MPTPAEARRQLWALGQLRYMFNGRPWQRRMYDFARSLWGVLAVMIAHRRSGKTSCGYVVCIEECLRNPGVACAVVCKTKEQIKGILEDLEADIMKDCPAAVRPTYIKSEYTFHFANKSKIQLLPADGLHKTKVRGRKFRFILITEAAFIPGLKKLISSVLAPTTRDVTGQTKGMILLESTPPDPDEVAEQDIAEFEQIWELAKFEGRAFSLPLSQNPDAAPDFVAEAKKDCGGEHTEEYQREYELVWGGKGKRNAVPEFTLEKKAELVRLVVRVQGADRYAGMDPGGTHPTGILWGWYWFAQDLLVIEEEEMLENPSSGIIAESVKAAELRLWGENPNGKLYRFSDNDNVVLLNDLYEAKVRFEATEKDSKLAHLNTLRMMVRDGRIAIHPRCTRLIATLGVARRSKTARKGFEELSDGLGHADLLDALLYIVRNLRRAELPKDEVLTKQVEPQSNRPMALLGPQRTPYEALRRLFVRNWLRR